MKKKKRTVPRFSAAAGLTWRMGIMVGVLAVGATVLLTLICALQLQEQWTEHTATATAYAVPEGEDQLPGAIERYHINKMYTFDRLSDAYVNLPLYKDPTLGSVSYFRPYFAQDTAMVFLENGVPVLSKGDYITFGYQYADSWLQGGEIPDGYGYIDRAELSETGVSLWNYDDDPSVYRLTGYFEGSRFVLKELASFQVQYPELYEGKTLAQWDREKGLNWQIRYEDPTPTDRETVCIYTQELENHVSTKQIALRNEPRSRLPVSLEEALLDDWPQRYESHSLWETVIIREASDVSHDGTHYQTYAAIRCYPIPAAVMRLKYVYVAIELVCVIFVLLYYFFLKRRLRDPLQQIIRQGQQNMLELKLPKRPKWKEPYLLEEIYIAAQQELQQLRQENQQLRQENQQLKTALDYAENAETNRRQLVSNITHELKTPLAVIHSYCEGLLAGIAPEKQENYLNTIMEEADRMDTMVLEMLDLSRLEAGKVRLAQDQVELLGLTQSIFDKLQPLLEAKGLNVVFAIGEVCHLTADEGRLGQVITNLVTNAIKYSPEGGQVVVRVFRRNGFTHFTIENESAPLSEEALERVWESFYRTEQSRTTKGTGLGLSICKAVIELHRGTCQVRNTTTGVEFSFSLPG